MPIALFEWLHRLRKGHPYRPLPMLWDEETFAVVCRTCLMKAARDDSRAANTSISATSDRSSASTSGRSGES